MMESIGDLGAVKSPSIGALSMPKSTPEPAEKSSKMKINVFESDRDS